MTEDQARQVLLVASREGAAASPHWNATDRDWATRQALATAGESATPEAFVTARAALALQRLLPRDAAAARWLQRHLWHGGWVLLSLLLGFAAGLAVDQLGPPQRVNLLAPAVWAVVLWNLGVYALLAWPSRGPGPAERLARWREGADDGLTALWARHAAPLTLQRLTLLMHAAAAALALGLIAGLYLRGLVLDYRAGWQSTFLDAATVQALLTVLLAPASALTGVAVPAVAPLQLAPGAAATASAAPWIHLLAATLALAVVLPRLALAALAAGRAQRLAAQFPLPLTGSAFEGLHPLMRPGPPRPLRLLWLPLAAPTAARLLGRPVEDDGGAREQALLHSPEGEQLVIEAAPALLRSPAPWPPRPWWRWWAAPPPQEQAIATLRERIDAVLLLTPPDAARPPWLARLGRPVLLLHDAAEATAPALPLQALADGWLADGRLWNALTAALPDDLRLQRLRAAWVARQQARLDGAAQLLAGTLARVAQMREPLPDPTLFGGSADDGPARERLAQQLAAELQGFSQQLAAQLGVAEGPAVAAPAGAAQLRTRVGEGRAALMGGVVTGAVTGLKADLASGGLTMGLGALTGGVVGAVGSLLAARGLNKARGTEQGHATWGEAELSALATALLQHQLVLSAALPPEQAAARLAAVLGDEERAALAAAWRERGPTLAARLAPLLARLVRRALGGPEPGPAPTYTPAP